MASKQGIFNIKDFRGGYATDLQPELMADNEMLTAKNGWWRNGFKKRGGITKYASCTGSFKGAIRIYEETAEAWYTIYAVDDGSTVEFQSAASDTLATIASASLTASTTSTAPFTTGEDVEFAHLGGKVVAVNGADRARVFYASGSGTFYTQDLDRYDERIRDADNWLAGQATSTSGYSDDTTDAQTTTGTFLIASATNITNGFYIGGDFTYSRAIFAGVDPGSAGSATGTYQYYGYDTSGSITWNTIGTFNTQFQNSAGTEWGSGTVTGEWELPLSSDGTLRWTKGDAALASQSASFTNRYMMRGIFAGQTSAVGSSKIDQLSHTHYLTQITGDQKPQAIKTHRNHMFIAARNQVQISIANSITGWRADRWEYFYEDDNEIKRMETLNNYLAVIKGGRMFAIDGTSWQNWSVRPLSEGGIISRRGAVVANGVLWMMDRDGLYMFDGNVRRKASKHIQTDIDGYTLTDTSLFFYKTDVMVMFPTDEVTLVFDPDTIRVDDMGDLRVSFNKWDPYFARQMIYNKGGSDDGNLILLGDNYLGRGDYLAYDNLTSTATIELALKTKLFEFGGEQTYKTYTRAKPKVAEVSATAGAYYTFKFLTEDEYGGQSNTATLTAGVGTGIYQKDIGVPYQIDGKLVAMQLVHDSQYDAKIDTISLDYRKRRY